MKLRIASFLLVPLLLTQCARDLLPHSPLEYSYARATAPFAAMSELVYQDSKNPDQREVEQRGICRKYLQDTGWAHEEDFHQSPEAGKVGLQYTAWLNTRYQPNVLCVVFRGTEFIDEPRDMLSNFHPVLGWLPGEDQYEFIGKQVTPEFVKKYGSRIRSGKLVVVTAGHSLGGGLAQNFMYRNTNQVRQCYAFDSSPVTGYLQLDRASRKRFDEQLPLNGFPDAQTVRVNQQGEILEPVRSLGSRFTYYSNQIDRITFDVSDYAALFRRQAPFSRHSISGLAVGLMLRGGYPVKLGSGPEPRVAQEPTEWRRAWWDRR